MSDEFNPMLPPLDDAKVEEMIGKLVLVGVTRYGGDGQVQGLEQYASTVLRISADEGVVLADEERWPRALPAADARPVPAGRTGRIPHAQQRHDRGRPDYLATWDLHAQQ
jgi:hypothetical protein